MRLRAFAAALSVYLLPIGLVALGACVGTTLDDESRAAAVAVEGDRLVLRGAAAARVRRWNGQARVVLARGHAALDGAAKAQAAAELFTLADRIGAAGK